MLNSTEDAKLISWYCDDPKELLQYRYSITADVSIVFAVWRTECGN